MLPDQAMALGFARPLPLPASWAAGKEAPQAGHPARAWYGALRVRPRPEGPFPAFPGYHPPGILGNGKRRGVRVPQAARLSEKKERAAAIRPLPTGKGGKRKNGAALFCVDKGRLFSLPFRIHGQLEFHAIQGKGGPGDALEHLLCHARAIKGVFAGSA